MLRIFSYMMALSMGLTPARACELALVLAVDVSGSVDPREYDVQMTGLATALQDSAVAEALVNARAQVMVIQWTGATRQSVSVPWTEIASYEQATALAGEVAEIPRVWRNFSTAIGEAIEISIVAFEAPQVQGCKRRVIDVSGDGPSNEGIPPEHIRELAAALDITINALAIEASEEGLTDYFRSRVIIGPGSFAMRADDFRDYPDRIRAKLLREVTKQIATLR